MRHDFDIAAFDPHPAFRLKRARSRERPVRSIPHRNANVWPLPTIAGISPNVARKHDGVLISYAADPFTRLPPFVPVFAVSDGVVVYAGSALDVHAVALDHGDGHRSFYTGLAHSFVMPTSRHAREQRVRAGDVLGYVCSSAPQSAPLHFTLMRHDAAGHFHGVDPEEAMRSWTVLPWADDSTTPPACQPPACQPIAA